MIVKLSTKGQLVIPKQIRQALNLRPGMKLRIGVSDGQIVLEPLAQSAVDALYGRFRDADLLAEHEAEHRQEVAADEAAVRA